VADLPRISAAELANGAADFPLLDDTGQVSDPLLVVDLSADAGVRPQPDVWQRAAERAASCPRVLIGLASGPLPAQASGLLRSLDVTLGETPSHDRSVVALPRPEDGLAALAAVGGPNPQAALVLGQVLRATAGIPVREAVDMESLAYSALLGGPDFRHWLSGRPAGEVPSAAEPVLVRRDGGRLLITLNRPERRNAYGRQLRDALADALRVAVLDPSVTSVILSGAGPVFSSGGDLAEFGSTPDRATAHFIRTQAGAALLLHAVRDRTEVRVHGTCVGAGVELPAFAGRVVAAQDATFRLPEVAMGLIPGAGGTVSIPRRIGRWRTLYLALSGIAVDAETALAWGLVDQVVPALPDPGRP
jgi:enoyl-CoA hydratase/carnithine racemase